MKKTEQFYSNFLFKTKQLLLSSISFFVLLQAILFFPDVLISFIKRFSSSLEKRRTKDTYLNSWRYDTINN